MATNPNTKSKAERQSDAREKARRMQEEQRRKEKRSSQMKVWGIVLGVAVVIGVFVTVFLLNSDRDIPDSGPAAQAATAQGGIEMTSTTEIASGEFNEGETVDVTTVGEPSQAQEPPAEARGGEDRGQGEPAQVIVYADFNCPHCATFEQENAPVLDEKLDAGEITLEYRFLNFLDQPGNGNFSSRAANAAYCVAEKNPEGFGGFTEDLFARASQANGGGLSNDEIIALASDHGADIASCQNDNTYRPFVNWATAEARAAGVQGTPTVFVNNKNMSTEMGQDQTFAQFLEQEINAG